MLGLGFIRVQNVGLGKNLVLRVQGLLPIGTEKKVTSTVIVAIMRGDTGSLDPSSHHPKMHRTKVWKPEK